MGVLKTITDELRRVQAERETQDLLEVLRRQLGALTFGDLAGIITSALGKRLAAVKVSALFGPLPEPEASTTKTPPATATTTPSKKPRRAAGKKSARKSKVKAKAASKRATSKRKKSATRATTPAKRKKAATKATTPAAKGKKAAAEAKTSAPARSSAALAANDAVLRTLAASAEPLEIRGVVAGAKLSRKQTNRALYRLVESGEVRMIGPKQRATYILAQGTGSARSMPGATPSPADAPAISKASRASKAAGSSAPITGKIAADRAAYPGAILSALRASDDWTGAADVRAKVGGSPEQMRRALLRLVSAGAIVKTGERNNTRYKLAASTTA